jgi:hypothetical protein
MILPTKGIAIASAALCITQLAGVMARPVPVILHLIEESTSSSGSEASSPHKHLKHTARHSQQSNGVNSQPFQQQHASRQSLNPHAAPYIPSRSTYSQTVPLHADPELMAGIRSFLVKQQAHVESQGGMDGKTREKELLRTLHHQMSYPDLQPKSTVSGEVEKTKEHHPEQQLHRPPPLPTQHRQPSQKHHDYQQQHQEHDQEQKKDQQHHSLSQQHHQQQHSPEHPQEDFPPLPEHKSQEHPREVRRVTPYAGHLDMLPKEAKPISYADKVKVISRKKVWRKVQNSPSADTSTTVGSSSSFSDSKSGGDAQQTSIHSEHSMPPQSEQRKEQALRHPHTKPAPLLTQSTSEQSMQEGLKEAPTSIDSPQQPSMSGSVESMDSGKSSSTVSTSPSSASPTP